MLYRISVAERGLTGIANIFRSRLNRLDDLLRAGTVPLREKSEYSQPDPTRPDPTQSRSLKPYISGTACLIDRRSSLMNTTWM